MPDTITTFAGLTLTPEIKTVMLDLDNTCYEYDPCHHAALTAVEELLTSFKQYPEGVVDFHVQYTKAQMRVKSRIPNHASSHSRVLYFQALLENLDDPYIYERCIALEQKYWSVFIDTMVVTDGLLDFLAHCHTRDTKVVVVSDLTTSLQCQKLLSLGMSSYVHALVTSEEAGAEKPDPRPFLYGLEKVGGESATAVMIGDNSERDITGAKALGIATILFRHAAPSKDTSVRQDRHV
ncbi:HAD-IA family hydrolase [Patescibacteria group bacterium]|nr:HAD-IA family hydrolase [Patescibacteria group bacterium]